MKKGKVDSGKSFKQGSVYAKSKGKKCSELGQRVGRHGVERERIR